MMRGTYGWSPPTSAVAPSVSDATLPRIVHAGSAAGRGSQAKRQSSCAPDRAAGAQAPQADMRVAPAETRGWRSQVRIGASRPVTQANPKPNCPSQSCQRGIDDNPDKLNSNWPPPPPPTPASDHSFAPPIPSETPPSLLHAVGGVQTSALS